MALLVQHSGPRSLFDVTFSPRSSHCDPVPSMHCSTLHEAKHVALHRARHATMRKFTLQRQSESCEEGTSYFSTQQAGSNGLLCAAAAQSLANATIVQDSHSRPEFTSHLKMMC